MLGRRGAGAFPYDAAVEAVAQPIEAVFDSRGNIAERHADGEEDNSPIENQTVDDISETLVGVTWGHPRIETIEGLLHLYRPRTELIEDTNVALSGSVRQLNPGHGAAAGDESADDIAALRLAAFEEQRPRSTTVCMLAVPSHMSVADVVTFVGAFVRCIRHMRIVRHRPAARVSFSRSSASGTSSTSSTSSTSTSNTEPSCTGVVETVVQSAGRKVDADVAVPQARRRSASPSSETTSLVPFNQFVAFGEPSMLRFNVLMEFDRPHSADEFVKAFDEQPFSTLGPETCRVLYIRSLEIVRRWQTDEDCAQPVYAVGSSRARSPRGHSRSSSNSSESSYSSEPPASVVDAGVRLTEQFDGHFTLFPPSGATELPSCPVCLERLDENSGGILTILCNHSFHCSCLGKWRGDSTCPVCRYAALLLDADDPISVRNSVDPDKQRLGSAAFAADSIDEASAVDCSGSAATGGAYARLPPMNSVLRCEADGCSSTESLWMCLICGHVGCGRYTNQHAREHYEQTMHVYSLNLESKRVWDYAGDHYAHRLVAKDDSATSAVSYPGSPLPAASSSAASAPPLRSAGPIEVQPSLSALSPLRVPELQFSASSDGADSSSRGEGAIADKLASISAEYSYLLEAQRRQYEELLRESERTRTYKLQLLEEDFAFVLEQKARAERMAAEAATRAKREAQRASRTTTEQLDLRKEVEFLAEVNKNLRHNDEEWRRREAEARASSERMMEEQRRKVEELEAQVKDLMFYIEAQQKLQAEGGAEGGDLVVQGGDPLPSETASAAAASNSSPLANGSAGSQKSPSKRGSTKKRGGKRR